MKQLTLMKLGSGLFAAHGDESREFCARLKTGQTLSAEFKKDRGYAFHKKMFALVDLLFDIWSETVPQKTYKGQAVLPEKERFRGDLIILAGFYRSVFNIRGEVRLEPESISFASMTQERFEELYSAVINVGLTKILNSSMSPEKLRNQVDQLLEYDR
jgi:hypothetical protein